jgi:proline iminopeptidase
LSDRPLEVEDHGVVSSRLSSQEREGWVVGDGIRLYVREVGVGPPVVVVHGGPDFDHMYLVPELDRLAASFHVVYYDQRGRGRSLLEGATVDVTMATEVDDLERLRSWLGLESMALLGHSWGGLLAMTYAVGHPDRVSHLVLMNTAPASYVDVAGLRAELARRRSAAQTARMTELRSSSAFAAGDIATEAEYYRIHYGTTLRDVDLLDTVVGRLRAAFTPESVLTAREIEDRLYEDTWARPDYDLLPALAQVDAPALVLHGDDDFVPLDVVRRIVDALPRAQLVVVPDTGHFSYLEQTDRVITTITDFLAN